MNQNKQDIFKANDSIVRLMYETKIFNNDSADNALINNYPSDSNNNYNLNKEMLPLAEQQFFTSTSDSQIQLI